jgi:tetratricopeptide (TPR) repeat protein
LAGRGFFELGRAEEAVAVLDELVEEEPENAEAHFFLGLAYRDLGRYSEAQKGLETYVALDQEGARAQQASIAIVALEQGYLLSEEKAIGDLAELLDVLLGIEAEVRVEEIEAAGRTLLVALAPDADEEEDEEGVMLRMAMALGASSYTVPRIDPPVDNGLLVKIEEDGKSLYTMTVGTKAVNKLVDGLMSSDGLLAELDYSSATGAGLAAVEEIEADLAETRELTPTEEVPFHPLTSEDLERYLKDSVDSEAREAIEIDDSVLTLLGIIGQEVDLETLLTDLYAEQVAGFYDPEEKAFYLVEEGEQSAKDQMVIAHEYVHALQDQHFGLEELDREHLDSDQRQAFEALVEGDATLGMLLYASEHIALFDLLGAISSASGLESEVLESSPDFIQEIEMFPYEGGLGFVTALYDSGGWEAVNEAYDNPPQSTEQILHPERYREEDRPETVDVPELAPGSDWQVLDSDVMGELALGLALAEHMAPGAASVAAEGWGGDRYALLEQATTGAQVLLMHTYWDDQDEADEFWALYQVYADHRAGYEEEVRELVGEVHSRWWLGDEGAIFGRQDERYVTILIGPDAGTLELVLATISEP